jgi:hypothetical protein
LLSSTLIIIKDSHQLKIDKRKTNSKNFYHIAYDMMNNSKIDEESEVFDLYKPKKK